MTAVVAWNKRKATVKIWKIFNTDFFYLKIDV